MDKPPEEIKRIMFEINEDEEQTPIKEDGIILTVKTCNLANVMLDPRT
jgi:hypothetical protein